ncbi:hypothetical protein [Gloeobacter violaceus]|uniref:Gll1514 protein n=1 Tax=Gloeobacter violaceus (strain ATCC 29082 / PCC 7421) TaxID=251221 RepID=Q7NKG4_GLOVI|nr:hypothetical protein [Gloeobacter violaceus]BAC89455.1 gll1514 [Gloeobacter violaceus PCC 7421]
MKSSASPLQKSLSVLLALTLTLTTVACGSNQSETAGNRQGGTTATAPQKPLADGQYPLQQANYNDASGEYSLLLLNTPPGSSSSLRTAELQMAQLSEEEIKAGKKSYLKVEGGKPVLYLTPDSKIGYVHNVTETKANPQTGEQQTVVVRQESSFWTPFAASLAGAAIGNMLFAPRYYMPPAYAAGGMAGYGGYGNTYGQAVSNYQTRNGGALPAATRNSRSLGTGGGFGSSASRSQRTSPNSTRSSGSGFGGSTLRSTDPSSGGSTVDRSRSSSGFGSGRMRAGGRRR